MFLGVPVRRTEWVTDLAHGQLDRRVGALSGEGGIGIGARQVGRTHRIGPLNGAAGLAIKGARSRAVAPA